VLPLIPLALSLSALLWLAPACAHPRYHYHDATKGGMQRMPIAHPQQHLPPSAAKR
jgi:hypothetical protein